MRRLELYIYDVIGDDWEGTSAKSVLAELRRNPDVAQIDAHIHSLGGDAFDGISITNQLRQHSAYVRTIADGIAASAASVIMQAGDERIMAPGAMMMIHDPWMFTWGNQDDLAKAEEFLEATRQSLIELYAERSGHDHTTIEDWMRAESWFTAQQAVDALLADRVEHGILNAATGKPFAYSGHQPRAAVRRQNYRINTLGSRSVTVPRSIRPQNSIRPNGLPAGPQSNEPTNPTMDKPNNTAFLRRLWNSLTGRSDTPEDELDVLDEARQTAAKAKAFDALQKDYDTMKARAEAAEQKAVELEQQIEDEQAETDEQLVENAVKDFRIKAADRDQYLAELKDAETRPVTLAVLDKLPKNLHKPANGVQPPDDEQVKSPITLTQEEARNAAKYRAAKAKADKLGVEVDIINDSK